MSIVHQRFTFIQCISLIWIFYDKLLVTVKLCVLLVYSILLYIYLHQKMDDLLDEMNWKVRKWYKANSEYNLNGGKVYNQMHRSYVASLAVSRAGSEVSSQGDKVDTIFFKELKPNKEITLEGPEGDPQTLIGEAIVEAIGDDIIDRDEDQLSN